MAVQLHRDAKAHAFEKDIPITRALAKVLAEYDTLPVQRKENGVTIRKRASSKFKRVLSGTQRRRGAPKKKTEFPTPLRFVAWVKDCAARYVQERGTDLDEVAIERLLIELKTDLKDFTDRVRTAQVKAKRNKDNREEADAIIDRISRRRFVEACKRLLVPIPGIGKPIDLDFARKQKRKLSRAYHPDLNRETEQTRIEFEAIIEAYRIVEQYAGQVTTRKEVNANGTT
jgi:hypothetical protein